MATIEEYKKALIKAGDAGDEDAARILASKILKMQASSQAEAAPPIKPEEMPPEYRALMGFDPAATPPDREIEKARNIRQFEDAPGLAQPVIAASDIASGLSDSLSFGYADKLAAYLSSLNGKPYDQALTENRDRTQAASDRSGWAGTAANVTGALATGQMMGKAGLTLMGRGVDAATPLLSRMGLATASGAVEGAGYNALDAMGHDTDVSDAATDGALFGGILGPAAEGIASIRGGIMSKLKGVNASPSLDELRRMKDAAYKRSEDIGAAYDPTAIDDMMASIRNRTVNDPSGAREAIHPKTVAKVDQMGDALQPPIRSPVSLYDIDAQRKGVRRDLMSADPGEQFFGGRILGEIDTTLDDMSSGRVTALNGTPEEAIGSLKDARELNSRYNKVEDLQDILVKANRAVDASETGASAGSQIRQGVKGLLNSDKRSLGFSQPEIEGLEGVLQGTKFGNLMRNTGVFAKSLPGRAAASSAGAYAGGMLVPGATGMTLGGAAGAVGGETVARGARALSERSVKKNLERVIGDVARGRPRIPSRNEGGMSPKELQETVRMLMLMQMQDRSGEAD